MSELTVLMFSSRVVSINGGFTEGGRPNAASLEVIPPPSFKADHLSLVSMVLLLSRIGRPKFLRLPPRRRLLTYTVLEAPCALPLLVAFTPTLVCPACSFSVLSIILL